MAKSLMMAVILAGAVLLQTAVVPQAVMADGNLSVDEKMAKLTDALDLTPEQQASIRPLVAEKKDRLQAAAPEDVDGIKEEYSGKIRDLLTEEQKVKYDALKKARNEKEEHRTPTEQR